MKKRFWNLLMLFAGASIFLTAHFYQSDTDQVSVKHTLFPGKASYRYVPDYPAYKRPGYRSGSRWETRDYSTYKTDSSLLFDKSIIALYDVTNKTKNYLIVPVTLSWEEPIYTPSSAYPSYSVIGAVSGTPYSVVEYYIMEPSETMKGMYSFSKPPMNFNVEPQAATVVDKKWAQGLQQALAGDQKKIEQYLKDTSATPAYIKLREKLSDVMQADLVKKISLKFNSRKVPKYSFSSPIEFDVQAENKSSYAVQATILADCFGTTTNAFLLPGESKSVTLGVNRNASCDTLNPKLSIKKVTITALKN